MLTIGCHVNFGQNQLKGCVEQALSYGANTFMFYTGAPQNTRRSSIDDFLSIEALTMMKENGIGLEKVVCHAPYIVNLANNKDLEKYHFSINFLIKEIERCNLMGIQYIVLHPGSAVGLELQEAIKNIIYALNIVLDTTDSVTICLETMAGKGTELGQNTEELKTIIEGIVKKERIGICLDTCHLNDAGVDLVAFDEYLDEFDQKIGIDRVKVLHINDSKNPRASHKDRHECIGYGTIGFDTLIKVIYNERLEHIPKILETPYIGETDEAKERLYPPYKFEIEMIKKKTFNANLMDDIRSYYKK